MATLFLLFGLVWYAYVYIIILSQMARIFAIVYLYPLAMSSASLPVTCGVTTAVVDDVGVSMALLLSPAPPSFPLVVDSAAALWAASFNNTQQGNSSTRLSLGRPTVWQWNCDTANLAKNYLTLTLPGPSAGVSGSLDSYCSLKPLCSGMGEVVPARTSPTLLPPIPSHCAVIILFQSVAVHQLPWLAL